MITILTQPIIEKSKKTWWKNTKKEINKVFRFQPENGPSSVVRSLTDGLKKNGIKFNINPSLTKQVGDTLIVLSDIDALRQAIKLKKEGKIKNLLAGPNLVIYPNDYDGIITSTEIDAYLVPSQWTKDIFIKDSPILKNKIKIWYAGVDEQYWKPSNNEKKNIIIYLKNTDKQFANLIEEKIKKYNYKLIKIIYGKYNQKEFKKKLNKSRFAVFLSRSESQGIALAETWSMNVPTLVWNPKNNIIQDRLLSTSSCPYLTSQTGLEWENEFEFENILNNINNLTNHFKPRDWVANNMTNKYSATLLLNIISELNDKK